jgi:hypothetical protein
MNDAAILQHVVADVEYFLTQSDENADLSDIEDRVRDVTRKLGCLLLQEKINRRVATSADGYRGNTVVAPDGRRARFERYEARDLVSYFGGVKLRRAYYWVAGADEHGGYAPLDVELGLNRHEETPALQRGLNALGVEAPFAKAERLLHELVRITVAPRTIAEVAEDCGGCVRAETNERTTTAWKVFEGPTCGDIKQKRAWRRGERRVSTEAYEPWADAKAPRVLYVQCDGGRLNTKEGWKEPKVAVLFSDDDRVAISKERGELIRKEYVATMETIENFQQLVWEAGLRWGAHKSSKVVVLGDGAEGFQKRLEELYPEALQILDWYHAAEHLWEVGRELHGVGTPASKRWVKPLLDTLRAGGVEKVIATLSRLRPSRDEARKKVNELIAYYTSNQARMRYEEYESAGYFIGSGAVESGVKNVVNIRMKGCGMKWDIDRADRLLASRARYLSSALPLLTTPTKLAA